MILMIATAWRLLDRRMRLQAVGLVVLLLVTGMFEALGIGLIFPVFQLISDPGIVESNRWIAMVHRWLGGPEHRVFVGISCVFLFLLYVFKNAFVMTSIYLRNRFIWRNHAKLANALLRSYMRKPYVFHLQTNSATLLRNLTQTVTQFFSGTVSPILMLTAEVFVIVPLIVVLLLADPMAALVIGAILGIPLMTFVHFLHRPMKRWGLQSHELNGLILKGLNHAIGAIREIKILGRENDFLKEHRSLALLNASIVERQSILQETPRLILEILAVGALLSVVWIILEQGRSMAETVPVLSVFGAAAFRLMPSFNRISNQINAIRFNEAALRQIEQDLDRTSFDDSSRAGGDRAIPVHHELALEDVSFRYRGGDANALDAVNFTVKKGESIAFVGPSGGGKSTLVGILLGLLHPDKGRILVDGMDVTKITDDWRLHAGFVPQETFLIDSTLRRNIALRLDDRDIDETRIKDVVSAMQIDDFASQLPNGLDTVIGERGIRLSGGQRQRIAIARALYDDPDILVMDEATSALDAETELAVAEALNRLRGGKTVIIIAHRLSTVKKCDRIYFLREGCIEDSGTFEELVARNTTFARMASLMGMHDEGGSPAEAAELSSDAEPDDDEGQAVADTGFREVKS